MHYFIDEAGDLEVKKKGSRYFLIGCITISDTTRALREINALNEEIFNSATLSRHWKNFRKQGFHATSNHPDIYSRFINLLNKLPFRAYYILVKKKNPEFRSLVNRLGPAYLYDELIRSLLYDRIIKDSDCHITISFEQNLSSPTHNNLGTRSLELRRLIRQVIAQALVKKPSMRRPVTRVYLQDKKSESRLALADYMNHILLSYLSVEKRTPNHVHNYLLLEKKIGIIHEYLSRTFFQPRKTKFPLSF
jgi:hypothetical protein